MGGSSMSPSAYLDETNYAHNVRKVVLYEKWKIEKKKDKSKNGRNNQS